MMFRLVDGKGTVINEDGRRKKMCKGRRRGRTRKHNIKEGKGYLKSYESLSHDFSPFPIQGNANAIQ